MMTEQNERLTVKAVEGEGEAWELDILGLPFGGVDSKDADGEWFAPDTQTHQDKFPLPPLVYYHGLDDDGKPTGDPEYIGKTTERRVDERGHWFRAVLDKGSELAKRVWEAAQQGIARASSGTAAHLRRVDGDGHIRQWPVVELSVFEAMNGKAPANPYAVAVPVAKAVYARAGLSLPDEIELPEATPEDAAQVASADAVEATKNDIPDVTDQGVTEMEAEEFKTMLDEAMKPVLAKVDETKAELDALKREPPKDDSGIAVKHDEADNPFESVGEQCIAVAKAMRTGRFSDPRLLRVKAGYEEEIKQTGASEGIPAAGGFLLDPTLTSTFLKPLHEDGPFVRLARKMPVSGNSNYGWINGVNETARADGSRWGGIRGYRLGEGDTKTASRPTFRRINWELHKYAVLVYATDELLQDSALFSSVVQQGAAEELAFMANFDILRGAGANGPLGILSAPCLVTTGAEAGQLADTVVTENINNMWQDLLPASKPRAAWFINSEVEPQLDDLAIAVGASALEPRFVTYDQQGTIRMKGRPVYVTEFNSALGDLGDIVLADMSEYLYFEKGGVQTAQSIHLAFLTDETIFRFVYRCDGQPTYASAVTPLYATAGQTQSPFVTLEAR